MTSPVPETTLDPTDWAQVRALGQAMVADMVEYLRTVRDRPVWQPVPADVKSRLSSGLPRTGRALDDVYEAFKRDVLPFPTGNIHPRFWGWVMGTGSVTAMFADMLASGMNAHVAGYDQSAALVERQVLGWFKEVMGFPADASGVLVSGGTAANLNGLMAARVAKAGYDVRERGAFGGPQLTVYGSAETHNWIYKACEMMGLGRQAFRAVAVDADYRIDVAACGRAIAADRAAGLRPIAIIGSCGTVNTGAIDDLVSLRQLADEHDLWFHIDGAYGSLAALAPRGRALVEGQASADSLAFDLHKWAYLPYEAGVILTRSPDAQLATWRPAKAGGVEYLRSAEQGLSVDVTYFADRDLQLSRGFRALKVWMSLNEVGFDRMGDAIQSNIDEARYLERLIEETRDLELLAPVSLNVVCFRYLPAGMDSATADRLNARILTTLQVRGIAVPSQTVLGGRFAIRVCITNHRSRFSDFDLLVRAVREIGAELQSGSPG